MTSSGVLIACVAENNELSFKKVKTLAASLATLSADVGNSKFFALFVDAVKDEYRQCLEAMGAVVQVVSCFDTRCRHANKLRLLEIDASIDYDILVALDTDTAVAGDFSAFLTTDAIRAKPVDINPLHLNEWRRLFEYFGLRIPAQRYVASCSYEPIIPYFNSGVLIVPRKHKDTLRKSWGEYVTQLLDSYPALGGDIAKNNFFTDQFALSLALQATQLPVHQLPIEMNFPTHVFIHPAFLPEEIEPIILHYHHMLSANGQLTLCPYNKANECIQSLNTRLSLSPSSFSNLDFWEHRYKTNPELGSGVGSRGDHLLYKRELIRSVYDKSVHKSVLDVGCGDIEVIKDIDFVNYTGIDISPFIVDKNTHTKPEFKFLCQDFTALDTGALMADLVLCFDVLIHQHDYDTYASFVSKLIRVAKRTLLVSGYSTNPEPQNQSEITKYYEPITTTIRKFTTSPLTVIGEYRGVAVVQVTFS